MQYNCVIFRSFEPKFLDNAAQNTTAVTVCGELLIGIPVGYVMGLRCSQNDKFAAIGHADADVQIVAPFDMQ